MALQALLAWPASEAFRQPVDPGYAAYHKVSAVHVARLDHV